MLTADTSRPAPAPRPAIVELQMPALFIPLKAEFFNAFCDGTKDTEYRLYGPRWNEKTCQIGRRVVLSKGYGIRHRRTGVIVGFEVSLEPTRTEAWMKCYGRQSGDLAACIQIQIHDLPEGSPL